MAEIELATWREFPVLNSLIFQTGETNSDNISEWIDLDKKPQELSGLINIDLDANALQIKKKKELIAHIKFYEETGDLSTAAGGIFMIHISRPVINNKINVEK